MNLNHGYLTDINNLFVFFTWASNGVTLSSRSVVASQEKEIADPPNSLARTRETPRGSYSHPMTLSLQSLRV